MADNTGTFIKLALFGTAGYLGYKWFFAAPTASAAAPAPALHALAPAATPAPAPKPALPSLDTIGRNTQAAATAAGAIGPNNRMLTPDEWNAYANQGTPGLPPLPDPIPTFGNRDPMTYGFWWQGTMTYLQGQGLSGFDIGSIPWWGWAAGAGVLLVAFGGGRGR